MSNEQAAPQTEEFQDSAVIARYIEIRDEIADLEAACKAQVDPLKAALKTLENWLQDQFNKRGVESSKTACGTAFTTTVTQVGVDNMDALVAFIDENAAWNMLNKVVNKTAVEEYVAEHGVPPPGVKRTVIRTVKVNRPK